MTIVKTAPCPGCQHGLRVSMTQLPRGFYAVTFSDGRDKRARTKTTHCPRCRIDLFQSPTLMTLTGLEVAQLGS
jgi:hypothetical protein